MFFDLTIFAVCCHVFCHLLSTHNPLSQYPHSPAQFSELCGCIFDFFTSEWGCVPELHERQSMSKRSFRLYIFMFCPSFLLRSSRRSLNHLTMRLWCFRERPRSTVTPTETCYSALWMMSRWVPSSSSCCGLWDWLSPTSYALSGCNPWSRAVLLAIFSLPKALCNSAMIPHFSFGWNWSQGIFKMLNIMIWARFTVLGRPCSIQLPWGNIIWKHSIIFSRVQMIFSCTYQASQTTSMCRRHKSLDEL